MTEPWILVSLEEKCTLQVEYDAAQEDHTCLLHNTLFFLEPLLWIPYLVQVEVLLAAAHSLGKNQDMEGQYRTSSCHPPSEIS